MRMAINKSYSWEILSEMEEMEKEFVTRLNLNPLVARILINRDINTVEKAEKFLYSDYEDLHSPLLISGMDKAIERISKAVRDKDKIIIFGDYDVDGMSSTSLLMIFFKHLNLPVSYYIPHRIDEGYGLNDAAIRKIAEDEIKLLITVDCGVTSVKEVNLANELGMDVIITDHHQVSETLPDAYALLNPSRPECGYPFKHLAGVGIAFKLICALKDAFIENGILNAKNEPNLKRSLDLVSLGTLADMVPLIGENHLLVRLGLQEMAKSRKVGLRALMNLGNFGSRPIADTDIGFFLAPRLNAIGRLHNAGLGVELLTTDDRHHAKEIAKMMDEENTKRQSLQARILGEVIDLIESEVDLEKDKAIVLASAGWHQGVIGIVASKVVERFNLPTILLNIEDEVCQGSARSTPNFHVYEGLSRCRDLLLHFGGHKYAAGLALRLENLEVFKKGFKSIAAEGLPLEPSDKILHIDNIASIEQIYLESVEEILELGPFGPQYPYPKILIKGVSFIGTPYFVGREKEHVRFEIGFKDTIIDGIGFGMSEKFKNVVGNDRKYDIVVTPTILNRGEMFKAIQLRLCDFHSSEEQI